MGLPQETAHDGGLYLFQDAAAFHAHWLHSARRRTIRSTCSIARRSLLSNRGGWRWQTGWSAAFWARPTPSAIAASLHEAHVRLSRPSGARWDGPLDRSVTGFRMNSSVIEAVETDAGPLPCAEVVLATGVETQDLCRPLGFSPQIYPVKGYSGTLRVLDPAAVPRLPFVDETELVGVAHYGDRLRVTAIAEFAGRDRSLPEDRITYLDRYVRRNFGSAMDLLKRLNSGRACARLHRPDHPTLSSAARR